MATKILIGNYSKRVSRIMVDDRCSRSILLVEGRHKYSYSCHPRRKGFTLRDDERATATRLSVARAS